MPNVFVNDSGTWKAAKEVLVRDAGTWKQVKEIWVKDAGVWKQSYPDTITPVTYSTPGTYTYNVPNGVSSVNVTYPTTSGIVTTARSVTPGGTVSVTIGNYGSGSSFGALSAPAFTLNVSEVNTNVDQSPGLYVTQGVATSTPLTFSGSGTQDTLEPAAAAAGIYYDEFNEGNQGDFSATVTLRTTAISYLTGSYQVVVTSFSGRGSYAISEQPSAGNSYRYTIIIYDPFSSNANYIWTTQLQQIVPISVGP